jgi:hypothetical protein
MAPLTSLVAAVTLVGLVGLVGQGCGNTDHTINVSDYNTSCVTSNDCAGVFVGDVCDVCCFNGAINMSDYSRYQSDFSARRQGCPRIISDCFCPDVPACVANQCALVEDAGAD